MRKRTKRGGLPGLPGKHYFPPSEQHRLPRLRRTHKNKRKLPPAREGSVRAKGFQPREKPTDPEEAQRKDSDTPSDPDSESEEEEELTALEKLRGQKSKSALGTDFQAPGSQTNPMFRHYGFQRDVQQEKGGRKTRKRKTLRRKRRHHK